MVQRVLQFKRYCPRAVIPEPKELSEPLEQDLLHPLNLLNLLNL